MLIAIGEVYSITKAAAIAEIDRRSHYDWMESDKDYAAAYVEARKTGTKALEDEAIRRAREGVDKPVWYQGQQCGVVREYSDTLLIFLMKGADPDKYRDQWSGQLTGKDDGPIIVQVEYVEK